MTSFIHHGTPLDLLFIDEFIIGAEVVSVGGALGFTAQGGEVQALCQTDKRPFKRF